MKTIAKLLTVAKTAFVVIPLTVFPVTAATLDDVQAPRSQDEVQAPRGDRLDEIQAPRGESSVGRSAP
jgi:hypothetical protein